MAFVDQYCEMTHTTSIQHLFCSGCFAQSLIFSLISRSSHVITSMRKQFGVFVFYSHQPCSTID